MSETTENNIVNAFKGQTEAPILKALGKILPDVEQCLSEASALKVKELGVMDPANVCMIVALSDRAKIVLRRFMPGDAEVCKIPELDHNIDSKTPDNGVCKYSIGYLKLIMDFFNVMDKKEDISTIKLSVKSDYPMMIENSDFRVIVAPRFESD